MDNAAVKKDKTFVPLTSCDYAGTRKKTTIVKFLAEMIENCWIWNG